MLGVTPGRSTLFRQLHSFLPRCAGSGQQQASFVVTADHFGDPPATEPRRVVVTGLGLVSPLGVGVQRSWEALLAGHVGTQALRPEHLPEVRSAAMCCCRGASQGCTARDPTALAGPGAQQHEYGSLRLTCPASAVQAHRAAFQDLPSRVVAAVPHEQLLEVPWAAGTNTDPRRHAQFVSYALLAAAEALQVGCWVPVLGCNLGSTAAACRLAWACLQLPSDASGNPTPASLCCQRSLELCDAGVLTDCSPAASTSEAHMWATEVCTSDLPVNMFWAPPACCTWVAVPCSCSILERSVRNLHCQACVALLQTDLSVHQRHDTWAVLARPAPASPKPCPVLCRTQTGRPGCQQHAGQQVSSSAPA